MLCLFFIAIGGVSASDVLDMSNDPDNSNLISDSVDLESEESVGSSYPDEVSVGDSSSNPSADDNSHEAIFEDNINTNPVTKTDTSLKVSGTKVYSGSQLTITLKDKDGKALKGKKIFLNVPSKNKVFTKTTDSYGRAKFTFYAIGSFKAYASFKGDSLCKSSKTSFTFNVVKSTTSVKILSTTVPRSTPLIVSFRNTKSNKVYVGKKIIFKVPRYFTGTVTFPFELVFKVYDSSLFVILTIRFLFFTGSPLTFLRLTTKSSPYFKEVDE